MPDCLDVWSRHCAGIPCAITVPTKSFATVGGTIEINLIALTNWAPCRKEVIDANIPGMAALGPSLKVGEFLLPSGLMAIGPDGHVAGSAVSPAFPGLAHAGYSQTEAGRNVERGRPVIWHLRCGGDSPRRRPAPAAWAPRSRPTI
jgi:hypothetical protein